MIRLRIPGRSTGPSSSSATTSETPAGPRSSATSRPAPPGLDTLTPLQLKSLVKGMSGRERSRLVHNRLAPRSIETLPDRVQAAREAPVKLTRTTDQRSALGTLRRGVHETLNRSNAAADALRHQRLAPAVTKNTTKVITQKALLGLLAQARASGSDTPPDLAALLAAAGHPPRLEGLDLSDSTLLKGLRLDGLSFERCRFDWSHFSGSTLSNTQFHGCDFLNTSFANATLRDCRFDSCVMREAMLVNAQLERVRFERSDIVSSSFEDSRIADSHFDKVALAGTHFLGATVGEGSTIHDSKLRDAVFFGRLDDFDVDAPSRATAQQTRPTAAMLVGTEARGVTVPKIFMKLDKAVGAIPLRIAMQAQAAPADAVLAETEAGLARAGAHDASPLPIGQRLIDDIREHPARFPESARIVAKARELAAHADSFVLPGGEDIPPALYGAAADERTNWGNDYRRSLLEMALIDDSFKRGIPIMAVCRGFQMANVYFGAQMTQHIEGHKGVQRMTLSPELDGSIYGAALKHSILTTVAHHQAIPLASKPAEHLEPSVVYDGLVKASEYRHGGSTPAVMLQFHPEFRGAISAATLATEASDGFLQVVMSASNDAFWQILADSATAYRGKKEVQAQLKERAATD